MAERKVELWTFDDWQVLLVDGKIETQDHSLQVSEVLHTLGIEYVGRFVDGPLDREEDPELYDAFYDGDIDEVLEIVRGREDGLQGDSGSDN